MSWLSEQLVKCARPNVRQLFRAGKLTEGVVDRLRAAAVLPRHLSPDMPKRPPTPAEILTPVLGKGYAEETGNAIAKIPGFRPTRVLSAEDQLVFQGLLGKRLAVLKTPPHLLPSGVTDDGHPYSPKAPVERSFDAPFLGSGLIASPTTQERFDIAVGTAQHLPYHIQPLFSGPSPVGAASDRFEKALPAGYQFHDPGARQLAYGPKGLVLIDRDAVSGSPKIAVVDADKKAREAELHLQFPKTAELLPDVELQEQQKRVAEKLKNEPAVLALHGLGSGKTLTGISAGERVPGLKSVVVPAPLRENFRKELGKYTVGGRANPDYDIRSYQAAAKDLPRAGLTIFDESQRMGRSESLFSKIPEKIRGKALFLTGTPVRNRPEEFVPLLKVLGQGRGAPKSTEEFKKRFLADVPQSRGFLGWLLGKPVKTEEQLVNRGELVNMLRGRVDYHPGSSQKPKVDAQTVDVDMTDRQTEIYHAVAGKLNPVLAFRVRRNLPLTKQQSRQLNSFMGGVRQVSNNPAAFDVTLEGEPERHSPKIRRIADDFLTAFKKDPEYHKGVIYSNYLDNGVRPVADLLHRQGISTAIFDGSKTDVERKQIVEDFNSGKVRALLVSGAGSEGLDLKGTQMVQIMEPHFNEPRIDQVIGRGVRHLSHAHLPEDRRKVKVFKYRAIPAQSLIARLGIEDPDTGADQYLYDLSAKKQRLVDQLLDVLREAASVKSTSDPLLHKDAAVSDLGSLLKEILSRAASLKLKPVTPTLAHSTLSQLRNGEMLDGVKLHPPFDLKKGPSSAWRGHTLPTDASLEFPLLHAAPAPGLATPYAVGSSYGGTPLQKFLQEQLGRRNPGFVSQYRIHPQQKWFPSWGLAKNQEGHTYRDFAARTEQDHLSNMFETAVKPSDKKQTYLFLPGKVTTAEQPVPGLMAPIDAEGSWKDLLTRYQGAVLSHSQLPKDLGMWKQFYPQQNQLLDVLRQAAGETKTAAARWRDYLRNLPTARLPDTMTRMLAAMPFSREKGPIQRQMLPLRFPDDPFHNTGPYAERVRSPEFMPRLLQSLSIAMKSEEGKWKHYGEMGKRPLTLRDDPKRTFDLAWGKSVAERAKSTPVTLQHGGTMEELNHLLQNGPNSVLDSPVRGATGKPELTGLYFHREGGLNANRIPFYAQTRQAITGGTPGVLELKFPEGLLDKPNMGHEEQIPHSLWRHVSDARVVPLSEHKPTRG